MGGQKALLPAHTTPARAHTRQQQAPRGPTAQGSRIFFNPRILWTSRLKRGTHVQIDALHGIDIPRRTRTPHDVSACPKSQHPQKPKDHCTESLHFCTPTRNRYFSALLHQIAQEFRNDPESLQFSSWKPRSPYLIPLFPDSLLFSSYHSRSPLFRTPHGQRRRAVFIFDSHVPAGGKG